MMNLDDVMEAVRNEIPEDLRDAFQVEIHEVMKSNDTLLHGVIIRTPDQKAVPTIYIEDCMEKLGPDCSMQQLAESIVATSFQGMMNAPDVEDISLEYDDIKDKLVVQLAETGRNKDRLKDLIYRPLDNGMAMIAYAVVQENEEGQMRFAVTRDLAKENNYDINRLFDDAFANTIEKNAPVMAGMSTMIMHMGDLEESNPLKPGFSISQDENLYVLSNTSNNLGASAIYYPGVQQRIGEVLQDNYYVLPSSIHETIIVPERAGIELSFLQDMVKDANRCVVDPKEVLSDRVLKFDREKDRLIEPKAKERDGEDRGDR